MIWHLAFHEHIEKNLRFFSNNQKVTLAVSGLLMALCFLVAVEKVVALKALCGAPSPYLMLASPCDFFSVLAVVDMFSTFDPASLQIPLCMGSSPISPYFLRGPERLETCLVVQIISNSRVCSTHTPHFRIHFGQNRHWFLPIVCLGLSAFLLVW